MASLVIFGGQSITSTGQPVFMNDVWLYTPSRDSWREVSSGGEFLGRGEVAIPGIE